MWRVYWLAVGLLIAGGAANLLVETFWFGLPGAALLVAWLAALSR